MSPGRRPRLHRIEERCNVALQHRVSFFPLFSNPDRGQDTGNPRTQGEDYGHRMVQPFKMPQHMVPSTVASTTSPDLADR